MHANVTLNVYVHFQLSCQIMDSSLVEIENTAEHDFLKGVIQGLGGKLFSRFFTILEDIENAST